MPKKSKHSEIHSRNQIVRQISFLNKFPARLANEEDVKKFGNGNNSMLPWLYPGMPGYEEANFEVMFIHQPYA